MYIGINGGVTNTKWNADLSNGSGAIHYNDPFASPNQKFEVGRGSAFGAQAGYNVQWGLLVIGLEADYNRTNMSGSTRAVSVQKTQWDISAELDYFGTVRARAGFLVMPNLLAYATGGFAWGQVHASQATTFLAPPDVGGRTSGNVAHLGTAIGGGVEWRFFQNWSVKGEFLRVDLGSENYMLPGVTKPVGGTRYVETFATDLQFSVMRAGLNFKF